MHRRAKLLVHLFARLRRQHQPRRIGKRPRHHEHQRQDAEQDDRRRNQAATDIGRQLCLPLHVSPYGTDNNVIRVAEPILPPVPIVDEPQNVGKVPSAYNNRYERSSIQIVVDAGQSLGQVTRAGSRSPSAPRPGGTL